MGRFDGCLLACDIDGTLIFDKMLPERNIEKIKFFVKEGGAFSLATGRTSQALLDVTNKLDCISPSVLSNGCVIYDFKTQSALKETTLSDKALDMAVRVAGSMKIGIELHTANVLYVPSRSAATDLHEQYESMSAKFVDCKTAVKKNINKIIYFLENEEQAETLLEMSKEYLSESVFYRTSTYIGGVRQNYLEQMPNGVSKAAALKVLCKMLNIKKGGFFAIGDYYNDVEMITAADISAVPEDSPYDVKTAATVVVGSAKYGAVADFIEFLEGSF